MLEVRDLTVSIGKRKVIEGASFKLEAGRVMSLVGESGSGKTMTAFALLDLLPQVAMREKGEVIFKEKNIFDLAPETIRQIRGNDIAMVFQEPFTALNPVMRSGEQISETISAHGKASSGEVAERVNELLGMVKLPEDVKMRYPHELSGGMRQRVVLAMALACDPEVLILDEPTTALDVSIQKEILDLIKRIQEEKGFAILFITHDFSVVNVIADEVCVMREGVIVEQGPKEKVLNNPDHAYTKQLIDCIPRLGDKRKRLPS
ncbi:ABC transporter ATP-binding protein [Candidatus Omnitrophota bacterium]